MRGNRVRWNGASGAAASLALLAYSCATPQQPAPIVRVEVQGLAAVEGQGLAANGRQSGSAEPGVSQSEPRGPSQPGAPEASSDVPPPEASPNPQPPGAASCEGDEPLAIESTHQQADWGIAAVVRSAGIPFLGDNESVASFVPMLFLEGDRWFMRGLSGGAHLWRNETTEFNALMRLRFFDIPAELQNQIQGDTADVGLQLRHEVGELWLDAEWMTDRDGHQHGNARVSTYHGAGDFDFISSLAFRYKTSDFNDRYFALTELTGESARSGWEIKPSFLARYHLFSDLYLLGSVGYTFFDGDTRDLSVIDESGVPEFFVGFGFFQHSRDSEFLGVETERESYDRDITTPPYVRLAHGWATPSSIEDIMVGDWDSDEFDNQLTSVFYGFPLTDELFGFPLDIYMTPGFVWHYSSEVQDSGQELVLAIKAYYTWHWPTTMRLGVAEGISWITDITYIERTNLEKDGFEPSELNNYLDFSLDVNLGALFNSERLERWWFGCSTHHRSSIFESASQFGRIKGGSNYNTLYLQYDFF